MANEDTFFTDAGRSTANDDDSHRDKSFGRLDGVRTARVFAFFIDVLAILAICIPAGFAVGIFGLLTLGLGWLLYFVLPVAVAFAYVGLSAGGPEQATPGMKIMGIALSRDDGGMVDPFLAILQGALCWTLLAMPVLLLVAFFSDEKRLVHDMLLGTTVYRTT